MGEAEDTAECSVPDTQDLSKKKKKNDVKTKPVQSKNKKSKAQEGYSDSFDKKLLNVVGLNNTEIALKSITVKVRNKLLLNSSGMEGGWFDQVYDTTHSNRIHTKLVMGGIENFLSRLLKDKIPWYHGILLYSDFYTFTNIILLRNLQNLSIFIMQLMSDEKYLLT